MVAQVRTGLVVVCVSAITACGGLSEHDLGAQVAAEAGAAALEVGHPADIMCGPQEFTIDDVAVSPERFSVSDLEFDYIHKRIAFIERSFGEPFGRVVVVSIDTSTAEVLRDSLTVVDDTMRATERCAGAPIGNGPEWAVSERGFELYYNKISPQGVPYIGRASQGFDTEAPWLRDPVEQSLFRSCALPSFNEQEAVPLLTYVNATPGAEVSGAWRFDSLPVEEHDVPELVFTDLTGASPGRQVPGRRELILAAKDEDGQTQMLRKDLVSGAKHQITSYTGAEGTVNSVSVVRASAYGQDAYVFYAILDNFHIDVYLSRSWGQVEHKGQIRPPMGTTSPNQLLLDDENFELEGEPYITITMGSNKINPADSSEIWFAHAFAEQDCHYRRISDETEGRRNDPEPIVLEAGVYVFYRQLLENNNFVLHRAATGL